jgi:quercetin dioxygenase-like cupin family protein
MSSFSIKPRSLLVSGKVVPESASRLKGRSIRLAKGGSMAWHSTQGREELIIAVSGKIHVQINSIKRTESILIRQGQCIFIPKNTEHRVLNKSQGTSRYLYVTG